jgi:histidine triad (HIT) family protein
MTDCLFCKIIAGEIPATKIFEDDEYLAILDINPVNFGHALLIPRLHYSNLLQMPDGALANIGSHLKLIGNALKEATQADGINIIANNEAAAGQLIFHTHIHIIPRYTDDGFKHWHGHTKPTPEELTLTAAKIVAVLKS